MCSGSIAEEYIKMIDFSSVVRGNDTATLNVTMDKVVIFYAIYLKIPSQYIPY